MVSDWRVGREGWKRRGKLLMDEITKWERRVDAGMISCCMPPGKIVSAEGKERERGWLLDLERMTPNRVGEGNG